MKDRCRCPACTAANTQAAAIARQAQAFGQWRPFVDAAPVRAHLQMLRAQGIGVDQIAAIAHLSVSHVRVLADTGGVTHPSVQQVRSQTAKRIQAIGPTTSNRAHSSTIDATGTRRRLQALVTIGWSQTRLAAALGRSPGSLTRSMTGEHVTVRTARAVDHLYERLWNTAPPQTTSAERNDAETARVAARARGWLTPLAWDDIDTDPEPGPSAPTRPADPDDIDEIAVDRAIAGDGVHLDDLTPAEQTEAIRQLTRRGKSLRDIAEILHTTTRTVSRRRAMMA